MNISNNLLLYGPPGTGKTYNTVNYAVSIVENRPFEDIVAEGYPLALEKYDKYTKMGRIAFMKYMMRPPSSSSWMLLREAIRL